MRLGLGGNRTTTTDNSRLPKLNDTQGSYVAGGGGGGGGGGGAPPTSDQHRVTRLEAEVQRLESRGIQLVKRVGEELEGVALLEKALQARARFPTLQQEPWSYGEQFVMVCNQLAVRVMQRLDDHYEHVATELLAAAERALTSNTNDPFAGFHPLRQALLSSTLTNYACLQRIRGESNEVVLKILERCVNIESDGRLASRTLFNLAAGYTATAKFDDGAETVTKSVALANHYLNLPLMFPGGGQQPLNTTTNSLMGSPGTNSLVGMGSSGAGGVREHHRNFQADEAHMAILGHHMIASIAAWTGSINIARHHAKLAVRCAETFLGDAHALTSRCLERLKAVESDDWDVNFDEEDDSCPSIPLQMVTFSGSPLSSTIPFTLVSAPPPQVMSHSLAVNTSGEGGGAGDGKLPPIGQRVRSTAPGKGGFPGFGSPKKSTMPGAKKKEAMLLSKAKAKSAFANEPGTSLGQDGVLIPAPMINDSLHAAKLLLAGPPAEGEHSAPVPPRGPQKVNTAAGGRGAGGLITGGSRDRPMTHTGARPKPPLGGTPKHQTAGGRGLGQPRSTVTPARGPGTFHSESAEKPSQGHKPRPPLLVKPDALGGTAGSSRKKEGTPAGSTVSPFTPNVDPDIELPQSIPARRPDSRDSLGVPNTGAFGATNTSFGSTPLGHQQDPKYMTVPHPPATRTRRFSQTPAIPAVPSHRVTTVIAKTDYERYMAIQEEVEKAITEGSAVPGTRAVQTGVHHQASQVATGSFGPPSGATAMTPPSGTNQIEQMRLPPSVGGSGALRSQHFHPSANNNSSPHSQLGRGGSPPLLQLVHRDDAAVEFEDLGEVLRVGNDHLKELSTILPDHTDVEEALWQASAHMIQRQWRITKATIKVRKAKRAVATQLLREQKALVIQDFFHRNMELKKARLVCDQKKHQRLLKSYATLIAAHCRRWTSVDVQGGIYLKWLQSEKERWNVWHRRECAATVIEAVWKSHATRNVLRKHQHAAEVLQRTWRLFRLYNRVRMQVFKRRDHRRTVQKYRDHMAVKLQKWGLKHLLRIRAKLEVTERKRKVNEILELLHEREHRYWEQLKTVDEAQCSLTIQNMCRRYSTFQQMTLIWWEHEKDRIAAARSIQRWFRFLTASRIALRCKQQKDQQRMIQRRKEEVLEGVLDMQKLVRGFLERRRFQNKIESLAACVRAALRLQKFTRRVQHRREYWKQRKDRQWAEERYLLAQQRSFSATKIQAIFRSHRDREFCKQYKGFMGTTRHAVAEKIQRTVRWWMARRRRAALNEARKGGADAESKAELRDCCAQRIQKTWRMHHEKSQMYDVIFAPTFARRKAATLFQRAWRNYASGERVRRLTLQRQATLQSTINLEHIFYYVIQLQSFARRFILTPNKVVEQKAWIKVRAATRIQSLFRGFRDRKRANRIRRSRELGANEEYEEEEVDFAAIRIQKVWRGFQKRKIYRVVHTSASTIAYFFRMYRSRKKTAGLRTGRKEGQQQLLDKERDDAAKTIQLSWRYRVWRKAYWASVASKKEEK